MYEGLPELKTSYITASKTLLAQFERFRKLEQQNPLDEKMRTTALCFYLDPAEIKKFKID